MKPSPLSVYSVWRSSSDRQCVIQVRALGGDVLEEFESLRDARRRRLEIAEQLDANFESKGWK